ncbi:MAG: hypothetical protein ABL966_14225 [Acidimicrobiales bacterium]
MTGDDEVLAAARQMFGSASRWSAHIERHDDRLLLFAEHPASSGLVLDTDSSDPQMAERVGWFCRQREVAVAEASPHLVHRDAVMGVRALAKAYEWPAAEVKGVAFLLFDVGALTQEEASWLAGYVAEDAPMEPVSPLAP